jgi:hypothetical protein
LIKKLPPLVVHESGGDSDTGTPGGFAAAPPAINNAPAKTATALVDNIPRMMLRMTYLPQQEKKTSNYDTTLIKGIVHRLMLAAMLSS